MIQIRVEGKSFGALKVLGRIHLQIQAGERVALTGPSGIGKSTLLRIVAGLDQEFEGQISRPDSLAIVFQEPTLLPWRTALDNLKLVHPMLSTSQAASMLSRVGLEYKEDVFPLQLSLGQQRRLSLARAFSGNPDLLIMDEPYASLDKGTAQKMLALTQDLVKEHACSLLYVTHAVEEAEQLCSRTLTLTACPQGAQLS